MKALQGMGRSSPRRRRRQLADVRCPVLVVKGTLDPDWADPRAEGEAIVADLPDRPGPPGDDRGRRALPARPVPRRGGRR